MKALTYIVLLAAMMAGCTGDTLVGPDDLSPIGVKTSSQGSDDGNSGCSSDCYDDYGHQHDDDHCDQHDDGHHHDDDHGHHDNDDHHGHDDSFDIPISQLPDVITDYISINYPGIGIEKARVKVNDFGEVREYRVELFNDVRLFFDADGNLIRVDD